MINPPRRKKGQQTRDTIVAAARRLLLDEGYDNFVFRRVATEAGVEPGNVQYYFANKRDLLWAVLLPELENYKDRLSGVSHTGHSKYEKIEEIVTFLLSDVKSRSTLFLWLAIWGMAAHDQEIQAITGRFYRKYVDILSSFLLSASPDLKADKAQEIAWLITSEFDGLMVVMRFGKPKRVVLKNLESNLARYICDMLEQ
ncbi:TetR/AcrR family transcriptional regulator [Haliea sp. E1-2-M8]|uniref:TetR/AcrR family transcriptional regulator n=1 Tax=Haliea sp. E1-2-M8 TaxID=3064706 RepID=UPI0027203659|nr:TetR/AcrR family transcriptional regulator [Haliea sp. E1-2-M8]MDO8863825.1 TetR/AcrR family transcriptional regulator [Haliea sp. E1-2-M8]